MCFILCVNTAYSDYRHNHINEDSKAYNINLTLKKIAILPFFVGFIKDLRKRGYPIKFVIEALQLVDKVEFIDFEGSEFSGTYNKTSNKIQFENSFIDQSTGKLKSYNKLNNKQISNKTLINNIELPNKFIFNQPDNAELISSSLGTNNQILLRYLYNGKNTLVILDFKTKAIMSIITIKKGQDVFKSN